MAVLRTLVFLAVVSAVAFAGLPKWNELHGYSFEKYLADFKKPYARGTVEWKQRHALFMNELAIVNAHNAVPTHTYKKGINKFSDWTEAEKKTLRGHNQRMKQQYLKAHGNTRKVRKLASDPSQLPRTVDWRNSVPPVLTPVKDQGQCGSCWAHAATEGIESQYALQTGKAYTLSQQQITSCTPNPDECGGTGGCMGAIAELAYDYITSCGGITSEWMYSYASYWGTTPACAFDPTNTTLPQVSITGYTAVGHNDAAALTESVANAGPIAVSVDASDWSNYEGGIFAGCSYAKNISMDHAVVVVGYGHDFNTGMDYWIVRNSWSPDWGENGFIKLLRTPNQEACGWNVDPANGDGCKGQTAPEWACGMCGVAYDGLYPTAAPNP